MSNNFIDHLVGEKSWECVGDSYFIEASEVEIDTVSLDRTSLSRWPWGYPTLIDLLDILYMDLTYSQSLSWLSLYLWDNLYGRFLTGLVLGIINMSSLPFLVPILSVIYSLV